MFFRLLFESFARQRRRKLLAGIAILLGTTAITAMLALATTIGDRIHQELAVYGANIIVTPKAEALAVNINGVDLKPATGGAYLHESDLDKLKKIFWANNITGVSPELDLRTTVNGQIVNAAGLWFQHPYGNAGATTGAPQMHPAWKIRGKWPTDQGEVVLGRALADRLAVHIDQPIYTPTSAPAGDSSPHESYTWHVVGIAETDSPLDQAVLLPLASAQTLNGTTDAISRVEIAARTKPEDAFARVDPDTLSPQQHEIWYCRPYANSIAYQIREAIPGADAQQVRRVEQTEGTLLSRISGLMWLVSAAALLAAAFAVSAAMATAVLERRGEIGLMRSLGASRASIALLFYAEAGLLALAAGTLGYLSGSLLAFWLGRHIFSGAGAGDTAFPMLNPVLLPVVVGIALGIAIAGSTPSIRRALGMEPSAVLRADA